MLRSQRRPAPSLWLLCFTGCFAVAQVPLAWAGGGSHGDPGAPLVLTLAAILLSAKLAGAIATRLKQPAVLGELLLGVLLGNLDRLGIAWFEPMKQDATLDLLARIGALLLLFQAGLESTVGQMLKVGLSAFLVASIGVVVPF